MKELLSILLFVISTSVLGNNPVGDSTKTVIQDLCWSPDDNLIYFSAMQVKSDYSNFKPELWTVYSYDMNSGEVNIIAKSALYVSVSPDGQNLTFSMNEDKKRNVYRSDKLGNNRHLVADLGSKSFAPSWSPDGQTIIFNSDESGFIEIYSWDKKTQKIKQLTNSNNHHAYNPVWSPDGKLIAYYLEKGDSKDQIHIMQADGSNDKNITNDSFNNIFPRWYNDKNIFFGQTTKKGKTRLFKIRTDGKKKRQVGEIESFFGAPSNDKKKIAYINKTNGSIIIKAKRGKKEIAEIILSAIK